ncbi:hypothetical protein G4Y79_18095 [Phototrophicus methaneseepsis]|uniref:Uncharacterized protein n=1 Tax=Phototrophicus methaneseepsis TaxID=2710758 RepID=A0A7S8IDJ1_9CHLR|nr:hypothetical protein [Phototrophicus methaneseepsis]QPC81586.1 hypothetical protein G4Y79_18095 [Phototrophicus methaneseepsis]
MLDDFRRDLDSDDDEFDFLAEGLDIEEEQPIIIRRRRFMGMTAAQRAFLSVILFLNVLVLGLGLLVVTQRIDMTFLSTLVP